MRFPQIVVCAPDDWVANQVRELAAEHRWLVREVRRPDAGLELLRDGRPTVLVVQIDPAADRPDGFRLVADARRVAPDTAVVVVSDAKLADDDRAGWAAGAFDLGARAVLFPPLTRPVLEDLVGGLMAAAVRRVMGEPGGPGPAADRGGDGTPGDAAIDLAGGQYEDA